VNVLGRKHLELSQRFDGKDGAKGEARYSGGDWITSVTGAPILADAIVALDCTVEEQLERHSHAIIIGRVQAVSTIKEEDVLVYLRGGYGAHQPL
jgi:flavin reductase (DIM6/NTAB) family NADH-FMN oxidoreductase RutF